MVRIFISAIGSRENDTTQKVIQEITDLLPKDIFRIIEFLPS